jgi:hypothetical protein
VKALCQYSLDLKCARSVAMKNVSMLIIALRVGNRRLDLEI